MKKMQNKVKSTMEQRQARRLNPSLDPSPMEKREYEVTTFRNPSHRRANPVSKGK